MRTRINWTTQISSALASGGLLLFFAGPGCGSSKESGFGDGVGAGAGAGANGRGASNGSGGTINIGGASGDADNGPCKNLQCQQVTCSAGTSTTVSGTIYEPAGKLPLYNIMVYVPNSPLAPIQTGGTCDKCGATISGSPVVTALTDTKGQFRLENVPVGKDIPLVIQVGKWRRQVTIPSVEACVDTPLTDANMMRLPRNKSEGDVPLIALTTGNADALECFLRKIGLDDAEFTTESGNGRVHLYDGDRGTNSFSTTPPFTGGTFTNATQLWNTQASLMRYDIVLLSCEGTANPSNKSVPARAAMQQYLNAGGRVFASHWHNYWIRSGPAPFPTMANFNLRNDPTGQFIGDIDTGFPKGVALADWLVNVGGSTTRGQLEIQGAQLTVESVNQAQRWISNATHQSVQYLTQNTPMDVPEADQCGRVVFSDIHVTSGAENTVGGDSSAPDLPFPSGCVTTDLTPQEKALVFMLFDLSACIIPDDRPPQPPPA